MVYLLDCLGLGFKSVDWTMTQRKSSEAVSGKFRVITTLREKRYGWRPVRRAKRKGFTLGIVGKHLAKRLWKWTSYRIFVI